MDDTSYLKRLPIFIDGTALEKVTSLEINNEANAQKIITMLDGFVGKSDGPAEVNIKCESAIPIGGPEYDYWNACAEGSWHSVQVGCGDKDYVGDGFFNRVGVQASSDKAASVSFDWVGKVSKME
jgi:hypothetical protein